MAAILDPWRAPLETRRWCHSLCRPALVCSAVGVVLAHFTAKHICCLHVHIFCVSMHSVMSRFCWLSLMELCYHIDRCFPRTQTSPWKQEMAWFSAPCWGEPPSERLIPLCCLRCSTTTLRRCPASKSPTILDTGVMEGHKRGMEVLRWQNAVGRNESKPSTTVQASIMEALEVHGQTVRRSVVVSQWQLLRQRRVSVKCSFDSNICRKWAWKSLLSDSLPSAGVFFAQRMKSERRPRHAICAGETQRRSINGPQMKTREDDTNDFDRSNAFTFTDVSRVY